MNQGNPTIRKSKSRSRAFSHERRPLFGFWTPGFWTLCPPWLTLAVLGVMSWLLPNRAVLSTESTIHKARVAEAMQLAPHFINGRWVGQDVEEPLPQAAREMLRPNALLSRSYSAPDAPAVHVLIVHCEDARDMIGHYPPICYPSSGWMESATDNAEHVLRLRGRALPVREYTFTRPRDRVTEDAIRVLNFFVLPEGHVSCRINDINRQSERLALSIQGVAQVQVITAAAVPRHESLAAAEEILQGLSNVLEALRVHRVNEENHHDFQKSAL